MGMPVGDVRQRAFGYTHARRGMRVGRVVQFARGGERYIIPPSRTWDFQAARHGLESGAAGDFDALIPPLENLRSHGIDCLTGPSQKGSLLFNVPSPYPRGVSPAADREGTAPFAWTFSVLPCLPVSER